MKTWVFGRFSRGGTLKQKGVSTAPVLLGPVSLLLLGRLLLDVPACPSSFPEFVSTAVLLLPAAARPSSALCSAVLPWLGLPLLSC